MNGFATIAAARLPMTTDENTSGLSDLGKFTA